MEKIDFTYITKAKVLAFHKCHKLFLHQIQKQNQHLGIKSFQNLESERLKEYARGYFKNALEIPFHDDLYKSYHITLEAISFQQTIFHPVFLFEDCVSSPDVVEFVEDGTYILWEFIYSPKTNKETELLMGYHRFICESLQLPIAEYKILKINPKYLFQGELNIAEFFQQVSFTTKSKYSKIQAEQIRDKIREFKKKHFQTENLDLPTCPHYKSCWIPEVCFPQIQENTIFTLRESPKLAMELYNQGITQLNQIQEDIELTKTQRIQVQAEKTQSPYVDKEKIQHFINKIQYPVYYLDFETINPQIPIYPNSRPYHHVPFMFSLHILESPDSNQLKHTDYIQNNPEDPRKSILTLLSQIVGNQGSILCFNDYFEKNCIREALEFYPEFKTWFESILPRFLDLSQPFRNFDYYSPKQKGSGSLKDILPAMTGISHSHLKVKNGHNANLTYLELVKQNLFGTPESDKVLEELKEYCRMDTYALYLIQRSLEKILTN